MMNSLLAAPTIRRKSDLGRLKRLKCIRQVILYDICRSLMRNHGEPPILDREFAKRFLSNDRFRRWIVPSGCFEVYNRLYLKEPAISSLHSRLHSFVRSTASRLMEELHEVIDAKPTIFKGGEINQRYLDWPLGRTRDLDIIFPVGLFNTGCEALKKLGWTQGGYVRGLDIVPCDQNEIAAFETGHFETLPFGKIFSLELAPDELVQLKKFKNYAFFHLVEFLEDGIRFRFDIDVHWNYFHNLEPDAFKLTRSIFPFASTIEDCDHLYFMLLKNHYEAIKHTGFLKNIALAILLLEFGSIDSERVYYLAKRDGNESAIAANALLLEKISPHLRDVLDPLHLLPRDQAEDAQADLFENSLLGLKEWSKWVQHADQ